MVKNGFMDRGSASGSCPFDARFVMVAPLVMSVMRPNDLIWFKPRNCVALDYHTATKSTRRTL
jgi:hypothetical protein